ncbi:MAG: 23S rRNA (pseudouridine(1915)-N(3))-methyltransferase RlmH [Rickettsiales bacterium]|nr:23S rRNA (pseudouridine(1915)-N(3))-methyltransferase RlmH [Rickettsiales bacterium]MCA0253996.1 23S rRNA (pseudouridine(1915)-N(3))-methyltransferase RlmH [Pseudomonadota bacterium]
MKIQIISVGKLSTDISAIVNRYYTMINWSIKEIELAHSKKNTPEEIKEDETKSIFAKLNNNAILIVLDENGKQQTSKQLADFFANSMMDAKNIDFVIGGAYGLHESLLKRCNIKLSLSKMTFPHQFAKLLLIEQIYRAQTLLENHPYHK